MQQYHTTDGKLVTDFTYSRTGTYRRAVPSTHPYRKAIVPNRDDLRGKVCPSCGLTRSMTNKCDCNS